MDVCRLISSHIEHVEVVVDFHAGPRAVVPLYDGGVAAAGTLDGDRPVLRTVDLEKKHTHTIPNTDDKSSTRRKQSATHDTAQSKGSTKQRLYNCR